MHLTERQQRVFDWLNSDLELPVFASVYLSAVTLMNTKPPGYITLITYSQRTHRTPFGKRLSVQSRHPRSEPTATPVLRHAELMPNLRVQTAIAAIRYLNLPSAPPGYSLVTV